MAGRPLLGAHVSGLAAKVIAALLDDRMPARLVALQHLAAEGRIPSQRVAEVATAWASIRAAAAQWDEAGGVADDSTADPVTAAPPSFAEVDTDRAAVMLRVSPNRIRQLARVGSLPGRKVGRQWLLDRVEVELRRERNSGPFR